MWGTSSPLDFRNEINNLNYENTNLPSCEFLTIGAIDARHIVKTLASSYLHSQCTVNFHVIESNREHIARSILLLNICLQADLGLQEASRYYLELLGNTLLTPGTAKYLTQVINQLIEIITQTTPCSWLNLKSLKYKDRDLIEGIFKFWLRAVCEGVPIIEYWDRRIRQALGTRYDYRDGVFDWDYHMVLKPRNIPHLTLHEYKFWRNNGIAFTWLETEPARNNPTLISNIVFHGKGFIHYAYSGDITNSPFLTWPLDEVSENSKLRATDKAEEQIIKSIYRIKNNKECPQEIIAAHRDQSVLNGTLITDMPDVKIEQETWVLEKKNKKSSNENVWFDIPNFKVLLHSASACEKYKYKDEWIESVDVIFVAHNLINQIPNIAPLMKNNGLLIVESQKFIVDVRKEGQEQFADELNKLASDSGLKLLKPFNPHEDGFARFIKCDSDIKESGN